MSGVTRTGVHPRPAAEPAAGSPDRPIAGKKDRDFEAAVKAKSERRSNSPGGAASESSGPSERIEASRDQAARSGLQDDHHGGDADPDPAGSAPRREKREEVGPSSAGLGAPGGVGLGASVGTARTPAENGPGSDLAARMDEIARRIVEVAQVRRGSSGVSEVRLELSLHGLGHLRVAVTRGEDGRIRIGFESASAQAAELVRNGAAELRTALESRGVVLQEITVKGPEGPAHRLEPAARGEAPEGAARAVAGPRSGEETAFGRDAEERERRRRPDAGNEEEEEA